MRSLTREFISDPYGLLSREGREPFAARVFGVPTVFISDLNRARLSLTQLTRQLSGKAGNRAVARHLFGRSVLYEDGETHRYLRQVLRPAFTSSLSPIISRLPDITAKYVESLEPHEQVVALRFFRAITVGLVASHYLGMDVEYREADRLNGLIDSLGKGLYASRYSEKPRSRIQTALASKAALHVHLREAQRRGSLLALRESGLSQQDVLDQAVTILFAGVDTISATLTWACMALLEENPRAPLGDEHARSAFRTALMSRPPVYFIPRGALSGVEIDRTMVPAGWNVNIMVSALHEQYFVTGDASFLMPYGKGPKLCPGRVFANTIGPAILNTLFSNFSIVSTRIGTDAREFVPGQRPSRSPRLKINSVVS